MWNWISHMTAVDSIISCDITDTFFFVQHSNCLKPCMLIIYVWHLSSISQFPAQNQTCRIPSTVSQVCMVGENWLMWVTFLDCIKIKANWKNVVHVLVCRNNPKFLGLMISTQMTWGEIMESSLMYRLFETVRFDGPDTLVQTVSLLFG